MFDLGVGRRPLVAAVVAVVTTVLLLAGCSSQEPVPPLPVAPPAPAAPAPPPLATGLPGETSPAALNVAEATTDPVRGVVLAAGDPARCLESQGSSRTVLDGRAVLNDCRAVAGQVWSVAPSARPASTTAPARTPAPAAAPPGPDAATYRLANTTRGPDPLCFEGAPRVARDGAANTACGAGKAQSWHVVPTSAGYYRLRTDADAGRCLGTAPTPPGAGTEADSPGVAMLPCEPLERPAGSPRSTQDWELLPAPPLPRPAPPARPRPVPKPAPKAPTSVVSALLADVNAKRASAGCGPVRSDPRLDRAAQKHARWMTGGGDFSHTGQGGSSPGERIRGEGWSGSTGENIATGQTSVDEVMTDWMNSPGHRRNILDCDFTSIGLARTGSMWVQDFGGD